MGRAPALPKCPACGQLPVAGGRPEAFGVWVLASWVLSRHSGRAAKRLARALLARIAASPIAFEPLHHPTLVEDSLGEASDRIEADLVAFAEEAEALARNGGD